MQRQNVRPNAARDLFGQGVIAGAGQSTIQGSFDFRNPLVVEVVKDPRINARPVMDWHGRFLRNTLQHPQVHCKALEKKYSAALRFKEFAWLVPRASRGSFFVFLDTAPLFCCGTHGRLVRCFLYYKRNSLSNFYIQPEETGLYGGISCPFASRVPGCESTFNVPDAVRGKKVRCQDCESVFVAAPAKKATTVAGKKTALAAMRCAMVSPISKSAADSQSRRDRETEVGSGRRKRNIRKEKGSFPWLIVCSLVGVAMFGVLGLGAVVGGLWYTGVLGGERESCPRPGEPEQTRRKRQA